MTWEPRQDTVQYNRITYLGPSEATVEPTLFADIWFFRHQGVRHTLFARTVEHALKQADKLLEKILNP